MPQPRSRREKKPSWESFTVVKTPFQIQRTNWMNSFFQHVCELSALKDPASLIANTCLIKFHSSKDIVGKIVNINIWVFYLDLIHSLVIVFQEKKSETSLQKRKKKSVPSCFQSHMRRKMEFQNSCWGNKWRFESETHSNLPLYFHWTISPHT